ncbi:MAG TPA: sigma 54-interacting transcriptional regulator [bacterium]|nr:sigma 54-interacting transcriptional regulator [bacterium]
MKETVKELEKSLGNKCPEIIKLPWKTSSSPTDHNEIRPFAEDVLKKIRRENPDSHIVVHLSPGTPAMHAVWLLLGTTSFIDGPISLIQTFDSKAQQSGAKPVQIVKVNVDSWLKKFRSSKVSKKATDDDGKLWDPTLVKSSALKSVLEKLVEYAPLRVPVLLIGERGTGKTTLANFLRSVSPYQKDQPGGWPVVVCGQFRVNPQLAQSELFGHVKGAFTGAVSDRKGLLETADNDSVFFDEIADIDKDTQRILMAAIEGRGFQKLGDTKVLHSKFRLISATNKSLKDLKEKFLDMDFFDRVAVFILRIPPLRECREDIPDAWRKSLTSSANVLETTNTGWENFLYDGQILEAFSKHKLPGNFRDLQKVSFHLLAALTNGKRSKNEIIRYALNSLDFENEISDEINETTENIMNFLPLDAGLQKCLDNYEKKWIEAAIIKANGNKSEAARLLKMPRKTFENKQRKLL